MKKLLQITAAMALTLITACGGGGDKTVYSLKDVEFTLSGPLYEGPNPAQYTLAVDLKTLLGDKYKEGVKITNAILKSAHIRAVDSSNFDGVNNFVVSLASDNPELQMMELAFMNPVKAGTIDANLSVSNEVTAEDYFGEKQFYIVVDAGLSKDIEADMIFRGDFEFELSYK
ncbi:MAG: hypothetical protein FJX91_08475 [Bacteroidetes bacterium]|nr:hypothetical protein [Bacteroidota bacterium]